MSLTSIDFYAYRCREGAGTTQKALGAIFSGAPDQISIVRRKTGWKGYERSYNVCIGDMPVGLVAEGGDNQRGWSYVGISGQGCNWVKDWDRAQEAASACDGYDLKRVDIAYDTFDTAKGFDGALAAYRAGGFNTGGRNPKCEPMKPERFEDSAIIRVGNRERDKYYRGYEKGKQMLGPQIAAASRKEDFDPVQWATHSMPVQHGDEIVLGNTFDWFRHEVELKPKSGPLPEDLIDRRDQYFAGAYPYLSTVLEGVESQAFVARRDVHPKLELNLRLEAMRMQWGNTLFTALAAHSGDVGAVWEKIVGHKHSQSLLEAGVLLVDHETKGVV